MTALLQKLWPSADQSDLLVTADACFANAVGATEHRDGLVMLGSSVLEP